MDLVFIENEKVVTDSLTVANVFDKRHDRVLQDIRELGCSNEFRFHHFVECAYTNQQGRKMPRYIITEQGFTLLAMGYTGQKAMEFKERYISEFTRMKEELNKKPRSQAELMLMYAEQFVEYEKRINRLEADTAAAHHRIDNFDKIDVIGNLQQRLNKMIRLYAANSGITFAQAWRNFRQAYNTAYRTNLTLLIENYKMNNQIKNLSTPEYLAKVNRLDDAIRVADKLLNKAS